MTILGIDIGQTGAIAALRGDSARVWDMPTQPEGKGKKRKQRVSAQHLAAVLKEAVKDESSPHDVLAFVEQAQATPQMGTASAFGFGRSFGVVQGALALLGVTVRVVPPVVWKRHMGLTKPGSGGVVEGERQSKDGSLELARRLYPQLADELNLKKHNGRADALLIAHFGAEGEGL